MAQKYLNGIDVDFSLAHVCDVAKLGDRLGEISGEARSSARNIQDIILSQREPLINGLR